MTATTAPGLDGRHSIDITTTGRRTGLARRIEIAIHNVDGRLFISGSRRIGSAPGSHNLEADPHMTVHVKQPGAAAGPAGDGPGHHRRGRAAGDHAVHRRELAADRRRPDGRVQPADRGHPRLTVRGGSSARGPRSASLRRSPGRAARTASDPAGTGPGRPTPRRSSGSRSSSQIWRGWSSSHAVNAASPRTASIASIAGGTGGWSSTVTTSRAMIGLTSARHLEVQRRAGRCPRPTNGKPTETR